MKQQSVSGLSFFKSVHNGNFRPRRSPKCKPSLLCGFVKGTSQALFTLAFLFLMAPMFDVAAEERVDSRSEYTLGPEDQVRVRVHEWRPSRDEIFEWKSLNNNDNYTVSLSGHIALPLLGNVFVRGMSTAELTSLIAIELKKRMDLLESPSVIVEVVRYRPFYIVGAVAKPGEYPYRPQLTVLKAYSIAGGRQRSAVGMMRLGREAIATRGELKTIDLAMQGLVSNIARLEAELANAEEIELPTSLMKRRIIDDAVERIVKRELLVFDMRKKAFETQLDALDQLQSFLEQEIGSMQKRVELHDIQVDTVQQELDSILHLFKKGLASAPRKLALQRALAQVRGDGLRLESILMQARQDISKTKITIVDLQAKRTRDISAELRNAQAKLEELRSRTNSSKQLLFETEVTAPQIFSAQENRQMKPIFKVLRQSGSVSTEFVADETTVVDPGDTIKVELPLSDVSVPSLGIGSGATDGTRIRHSAREGLRSFPIE